MFARCAILAGGLLLTGCATSVPLPSIVASPLADTPGPSASIGEPSSSTLPLELAAGSWWRLSWTDGGVAMPDHEHLRVGLLDGIVTARIATADMWHEPTNVPIVRGPVAGLVLYGRSTGDGIDLHLRSAATGADRVVAQMPSTVQDAEIAPGGNSIFWIDGSSTDGGVWHLDLATGRRTRLLTPVVVAAGQDGIVLAGVVRPRAQLALSADGSRLAALWCGVERCVLQVLRLETNVTVAMPLDETWHELLGLAGDSVVLQGICADPKKKMLSESCEDPDARAVAADWSFNLLFGAELPASWTLDVIRDPRAQVMEFTLLAIAVPGQGGRAIPLTALGLLFGQ
jgi:hypothetical protein